jgi:hypothetical protein
MTTSISHTSGFNISADRPMQQRQSQPQSHPTEDATTSTDLMSLFSSEGGESVTEAALRDFCSAPAKQQQQQLPQNQSPLRAGSTETSRNNNTLQSNNSPHREGQPRRSSSRHSIKKGADTHDTALVESRSATPSSASSTSSDPGHVSDVSAASSGHNSDASRSPPPRRHKQSRGEGERNSPAITISSSKNNRSSALVTGGQDFSANSSEALARIAYLDRERAEEARVPPRKAAPPRAARYNTFGELDRTAASVGAHSISAGTPAISAVEHARAIVAQSGDLARWLSSQGFDESIYSRLVAAGALSMSHASRLTKSNLKQLLGVGNGIRLHMAMREVEAARAILVAAGESLPDTEMNGSILPPRRNGRGKLNAASCLPNSHLTDTRSDSPGSLFRELHPPGLHGYCALSDCDLPANVTCASRTCQVGLCTFHSNKLIITGANLCEHCYQHASVIDSIRDATGITALQEQGYLQPVEQCVVQ